ncbi:MAG: proline--tRNA ligase [Candidatus Coatesbacteria bacterium]|nr:proline--tRNA ligase [Candidatus Coatesbacteria bacterium]
MSDNNMQEVRNITKKSEDFSRWYVDVIKQAKLADYAPIRGCQVIMPYGFGIWEKLQSQLDERFKATNHVNAYFPIFVPESFLTREAEHVEGFAPEVAWVTQGGNDVLEERLALRPTSEAIIGEMYSKWIQTYRDLPVLINQWANVIRWEKVTRLFLRTTEFLWQEGHTCHRTYEEAQEETLKMLDVYREFAENVMAIPVIYGQKTDSEKFAGALATYGIEALAGDGKAIQAGTSHNLGQNFAKAFNIMFLDEDQQRKYVWQTSWGVSTRLIGGIIMVHGDDNGLILPPKLAPVQVVIVPITFGKNDSGEKLLAKAREITNELKKAGVSVQIDDRDEYRPGWKFNEWELKGVPLRIEFGPKDYDKQQVVCVRRLDREKSSIPISGIVDAIKAKLDEAQKALYDKALKYREEHTRITCDYEEFKKIIEEERGFIYAPWCGDSVCEAKIKDETKAITRVIPFNGIPVESNQNCIVCKNKAKHMPVFARSY